MVQYGNHSDGVGKLWVTLIGCSILHQASALVRDLIRVGNGGLTPEDLVSVFLGFRLSQFEPTKIRMWREGGGSMYYAYLSQHGSPNLLCVPYNLFFPRGGRHNHTHCCAITGLSRTYACHVCVRIRFHGSKAVYTNFWGSRVCAVICRNAPRG